MNLLPPQQVQSSLNAEEALRISRIKTLRESEESLRISIAKAEADFQRTLANNRKEWETEWAAHQEEVRKMKIEIDRLKAEAIQYAIPFDILSEGADDRLMIAQDLLKHIKQQESDNNETRVLLEQKLTEVEDREDALSVREQKIIIKEKVAEKTVKESQDAQEKLALAVQKFNEDSSVKRIELQAKETSLSLRETSLNSREKGLEGKEIDL